MGKKKRIVILMSVITVVLAAVGIYLFKDTSKVVSHSLSKSNKAVDKWCNSMYKKYTWEKIGKTEIKGSDFLVYTHVKSDINFDDMYYYYGLSGVEQDILGEQLDIKRSETFDKYPIIQEIRAIKGLTSACNIAVKWTGDDKYYLYCNSEYEPESLEQYLQDLGVEEFPIEAKVSLCIEDKSGEIVEEIIYMDKVEEMLQKYVFDVGGKYLGTSEDVCSLMIGVGIFNINTTLVISFTNDNNLVINNHKNHQRYVFEFGEDNIKALEDYIEHEMKGYLIDKDSEEPSDKIKPSVVSLE